MFNRFFLKHRALTRRCSFLCLGLLIARFLPSTISAQETAPAADARVIAYNSSTGLADPVALLEKKIRQGNAHLEFEPEHGYLKSLLQQLNIPLSSQALVFSKTSSQRNRTSPKTPRAIYFGDEVSLGWVPGGDVIDLAAIDPKRGTVFYTLDQHAAPAPEFKRRTDCLQCHEGPKTLFVPGLLVRSVYTSPDGSPLESVEGFVSGHNSSLERRWGGWYVTGTHPGQFHRGNIVLTNGQASTQLDLAAGANLCDLSSRFDTSRYLSPHSDLVALLVLEHEVRMHNLITHAGYEARCAADAQTAATTQSNSDWARKRVALAGDMLLEYMLFRDEAPLKGPVKGTSQFAREFEQHGPKDSKDRSLFQLDLQTRLLRYPCSFLIYSTAFDALPETMKNYLWQRLEQILSGADRSGSYATMTAADRQSILEILLATKPEFAQWTALSNTSRRAAEASTPAASKCVLSVPCSHSSVAASPSPPLQEESAGERSPLFSMLPDGLNTYVSNTSRRATEASTPAVPKCVLSVPCSHSSVAASPSPPLQEERVGERRPLSSALPDGLNTYLSNTSRAAEPAPPLDDLIRDAISPAENPFVVKHSHKIDSALDNPPPAFSLSLRKGRGPG